MTRAIGSSYMGAMKFFASLLLVVLVSCGSKQTPSSAAGTQLPDVPFEQLNHEQQIEFMKTKVVPTMEPIFKNHDPEEFADFSCKTCHGDGAEKGEFHMPNPELPKLNFADLSKWKKEDLEWMGKVVKPTMAKLLGETEATQENPEGFGCLHCHTQEGQ